MILILNSKDMFNLIIATKCRKEIHRMWTQENEGDEKDNNKDQGDDEQPGEDGEKKDDEF